MKGGKKPTREQRKFMERCGIRDTDKWKVERDTPEKMVLVHRNSDKTIRVINKE